MIIVIIDREFIVSLDFYEMMEYKFNFCLRLPNYDERDKYKLNNIQYLGIPYVCEADEKTVLFLSLKGVQDIFYYD
jgi:glutaredoxin-related protein